MHNYKGEDYVYFGGASGTVWIDDRYKFFSSTGTVPIFRPDVNIRIYRCQNCKAMMLVNMEKITTVSLSCSNCGSPDMKREE